MARKSFKTGLGELITNSSIESDITTTKNDAAEDNASNDKLNFVIAQLKKELHLWRTGKLTVDIFEESIKDCNLKYNKDTNEFSKIKK